MVKVIQCNFEEFLKQIIDKKVFCFGGGNVLKRFLSKYRNIDVLGIIDNYKHGEQVKIRSKFIKLISLQQYEEKFLDRQSVLVITCARFDEILEQLNKETVLDGLICYLAVELMWDYPKIFNYHSLSNGEPCNHNEKSRMMIEGKRYESRKSKFQVWNYIGESWNAGSKAVSDIYSIFFSIGYDGIGIHPWYGKNPSYVYTWSLKRNNQDWINCYDTVTDGSFLLLQHPLEQKQGQREIVLKQLKEKKKIHIISFVHDVDELRQTSSSEFTHDEFRFMVEISDVLIVHNSTMKEFFLKKGVESNRLVVLELFDYLTDGTIRDREFQKTVVIAGNLSPIKSRYIGYLGDINECSFQLYGNGYPIENQKENMVYHGSFEGDEIINQLCDGFGLVWDGDSLDTCSGPTGNYLRYNNPHKLSLYLAAGLPVIVWDQAASAKFVRKHNIGVTISSLWELPDVLNRITKDQFLEYKKNILPLAEDLRQGVFTLKAVKEAERIITSSRN